MPELEPLRQRYLLDFNEARRDYRAFRSEVSQGAGGQQGVQRATEETGNVVQRVFRSVMIGAVLAFRRTLATGAGAVQKFFRDFRNEEQSGPPPFERPRRGANRFAGALASLKRIAGRALFAPIISGLLSAGTAFITAARRAAEFQREFAEVRTLIDETKVSSQRLADSLKRVYRDLPVDLSTITRASYQAISAGVDPAQIEQFLHTAGRAAVGGVTEVDTAVDGLTNAINGFGLSIREAEDVADQFFIAVREGKTTFAELSAGIGTVAGDANDMEVKLEEVLSTVAALTTTGIDTSAAFTQVGAVFTAFRRNADDFEKIGVNLDESLAERGLAGTLALIRERAEATDTELVDLFGRVEGARATLTLTGAAGDQLAETLEAMQSRSGATATAFEKVSTQTGALWQSIKNRLSVTMLNLGESVLPLVNGALETVLSTLEQFDSPLERTLRALEQRSSRCEGVPGSANPVRRV